MVGVLSLHWNFFLPSARAVVFIEHLCLFIIYYYTPTELGFKTAGSAGVTVFVTPQFCTPGAEIYQSFSDVGELHSKRGIQNKAGAFTMKVFILQLVVSSKTACTLIPHVMKYGTHQIHGRYTPRHSSRA